MPHLDFYSFLALLGVVLALFSCTRGILGRAAPPRALLRIARRLGDERRRGDPLTEGPDLELSASMLGPERTTLLASIPPYPLVLDLEVTSASRPQAAISFRCVPAELATSLVDERLCRDLFRLRPLRLRVEPGRVRLVWPEWLQDPTTIELALELATLVARRIPEAFAAAEEQLLRGAPRRGDPYRAPADADVLAEARRRWTRQVERALWPRRALGWAVQSVVRLAIVAFLVRWLLG